MQGAAARLRREHNANAWLAWHIEGLARTKKLPKLDKLTIKDKQPVRQQSPEEQWSVWQMWNAHMTAIRKRRNG